jgi:hypothetical protein
VAPSWLKEGRHITRAASLIQGTAHGQAATIQHMRIHHGGFHIFVPEKLLDRPDVVALLQQMRGKGMPTLIVTLLIMRRWRRSGPRTIPVADNR